MKKYLLYAWIVSAFCSCSDNSMEPLPIEVDADCVDIVNDESFVPVSQATEVAGLFLAANGKELIEIEEIELEPSLGNGGLGRLAACFLDSIATLGLNGDGVGLNYHYGLFKQVFKNNKQTTEKNPWITPESWLNKSNIKFDVLFGGFKVTSTLYDIDVTGYNQASNKLRLFDVDTVNETIVKDGINFDKEDIKENLTLFL